MGALRDTHHAEPVGPSSLLEAGNVVQEHEKDSILVLGSPTTSLDSGFDFTEEEERRVKWKLNFTVLPLLFLGFYVFQLERGNIANALTDDFMVKVEITQDQFNTGQALLFVGIILGELPSQYILQWVGPQLWISFQVLAFGSVATFQAFQNNYASFLTTRILLGLTECGYIPGSLYVLSTFYKRSELATVTAVFFLGNTTASATSGLLAYGILPLGKRYTQLWGWQWLMIIEGSMAIFVSLLIITFLPGSPTRPRPLFMPIRYFTDREEQILAQRVILDDKAKAAASRRLTRDEILGTLGNWRIWPHVLMAIAYIAPTACLGTYGPSLIRGFQFEALTANALSSVAGWTLVVLTFVYGYTSDKLRLRGPLVLVALAIALSFWIAFQQKSLSSDRWLKYALQVMAQGFNSAFHPVNATWTSLNCRTPQERSIAMAMFIMAANSGGLVGSQLLRGDDAPLYKRGFRVCVALMAFALAVGILQHIQYRLSNKRLEKQEEGDVEEEQQVSTKGFRYTS